MTLEDQRPRHSDTTSLTILVTMTYIDLATSSSMVSATLGQHEPAMENANWGDANGKSNFETLFSDTKPVFYGFLKAIHVPLSEWLQVTHTAIYVLKYRRKWVFIYLNEDNPFRTYSLFLYRRQEATGRLEPERKVGTSTSRDMPLSMVPTLPSN